MGSSTNKKAIEIKNLTHDQASFYQKREHLMGEYTLKDIESILDEVFPGGWGSDNFNEFVLFMIGLETYKTKKGR